jgi:hypothetical protein
MLCWQSILIFFHCKSQESLMENTSKLFDDITNLIQKFKWPGVDPSVVLHRRRKDVEALLDVTRIVKDGARSMANKQVDMLRATLEDLPNVLRLETSAEGKVDAVRQAVQKALTGAGELADIALKSQAGAFDAVSR